MTDLPSSLGIEAVELVADGGRNVTVRVIGRWRRRRPELRGQPMLVVDAEGGRQRFLAMPEPPSLTGAAPGTWRMSFSVPAELAPQLPGRTFLQLGGVMVPLPVGEVPDSDLLESRRARGSELAAESARRRAAELADAVSRLERELDEARDESERLRADIAGGERRLRVAEQHVHAERALRAEVEQRLSRRARVAEHDLRVLHERVAELERELTRMRRAVDEAQHLAAAAEAGRAEAERRLAKRPPGAPGPGPRSATRELELLRATPRASPTPTPPVADRAGDAAALALERSMAEGRAATRADPRVAMLERELATAREEIEAQRRRSARAYEAIAVVRGELRQLRATSTAPVQPASPAPAPEPVQAERLSAALARLREQAPARAVDVGPPPDPGPLAEPSPLPAANKPWLAKPFRALAAQDPSAAGRLLLALLPAQRAADPHPVAYDLILSDLLVAHVTVGSAAAHVALDATARPRSEVDFQLVGDLASVARLLATGPVRRRLRTRRRIAGVRGDRRRLSALDRLIHAPLSLQQLHAAGVRLDPVLAFTLAGLAVEPEWTAGERFAIGHREPRSPAPDAYLHVRDGKPALASAEPPHGPVAAVIVCPGDELLVALGRAAGAAGAAGAEGEERPLSLVAQWLERAQCG